MRSAASINPINRSSWAVVRTRAIVARSAANIDLPGGPGHLENTLAHYRDQIRTYRPYIGPKSASVPAGRRKDRQHHFFGDHRRDGTR